MQTDVINPVLVVRVRGEAIDVRELKWRDALRLVKDITNSLTELLAKRNAGGQFELAAEDIIAAITKTEDVAAWSIQASTGKPSEWVNELSTKEAMQVIDAIVQLNLSPDVVGSGKELAGHLSAVFGSIPKSLASSTT